MSDMTREQLAEALSHTAYLLNEVWRGRITERSTEVGDALTKYAMHPSHFLGCECHPDTPSTT